MNRDLVLNKIVIPGVILTVVAFLSGFMLSHVNKVTKPEIDAQKEKKDLKSITLVLSGYSNIEKYTKNIDGKNFEYWVGTKKDKDNNDVNGYAFKTSSPGFEDNVESMVGVNNNGIVLGLTILEQKETPGFGARSIEVASNKTIWGVIANIFTSSDDREEKKRPWFQEQFNGLDINKNIEIEKLGNWTPALRNRLLQKNAITAISGATITSTAVTDSLKKGIQLLNKAVDLKTGTNR